MLGQMLLRGLFAGPEPALTYMVEQTIITEIT